MIPEESFDVDEAESLLRDAEAVLYELLPNLDEEAGRFSSESFEATVTNDDGRLLRLAEDARDSALAGRMIAACLEAFAAGVELRSMPLCRAAAYHLRVTAEMEFRLATSLDPMEDYRTGVFGMPVE